MAQNPKTEHPTPRPRWQFKIKALLILVFLSSFIALAGSFAHTSFKQAKIVERLGPENKILYDYEFKDGQAVLDRNPPGPDWIKNRFGKNFFARVTFVKIYGKPIKDIESIYYLHNLEHLAMFNCDSLTDINYIQHFKKLAYLDLGDCDGLTDVSPLKNATSLRHLDLYSCDNVVDLDFVENLTEIQYLDISNCEEITELEFLRALKNLETFKFAKSPLKDVVCLENNLKLRELHLEGSMSLENLDGLENLSRLQIVNIRGCKQLSKPQVDRLSKLMPGTNVVSDF